MKLISMNRVAFEKSVQTMQSVLNEGLANLLSDLSQNSLISKDYIKIWDR